MVIYFFYFFLMWTFAFFELFKIERRIYIFSVIVFMLFLACRLDTGFDWPVYKQLFQQVSTIHTFSELYNIALTSQKEIGFIVYLKLLSFFSDNYQIVIIVTSFIEVYALIRFLKITSYTPATILAVAGTWLLFSLYFSVIRQGLAVAFFLLFFRASVYKHTKVAILLFIVSVSMQTSAIIYFIIYYFSNIQLKRTTLLYVFLLAFIFSFFSSSLTSYLFSFLYELQIPIISNKALWYMHKKIHVNYFDIIFVYVYSLTMFLFLYTTWQIYPNKSLEKRLGFFAFIFIVSQLLFINYPLLRHRIEYVSFIFQFILIFNFFYLKDIYNRVIIFFTILAIFLLYFTVSLTKQFAIAYVPYQDCLSYSLYNKRSTGLDRQEKIFDLLSH